MYFHNYDMPNTVKKKKTLDWTWQMRRPSCDSPISEIRIESNVRNIMD